MNNPLKDLRQECNFTLEEVADRASVSKLFLIRAEQGCFSSCPERLVEFYGRYVDLDYLETASKYLEFQSVTRVGNYGRLIEPWEFPKEIPDHPFIHWRQCSGLKAQISISKLFCIHPAVVFKFENKPRTINSVPQQLQDALLESGYERVTINLLSTAYAEFKDRLINSLEVV